AGVVGAAVAIVVLGVAQMQIVPKIAATLQFVPFHVNQLQLAGELLLVGTAVGLISSWFSVGRYLRA
ncbi:MAG TPA: hypothetical protein VNG31_04790, partial [Candidatus Baltobacteraceae bacterium]|nr:hypothetical protein [Candidatus Baltobacteraceae bacterium]